MVSGFLEAVEELSLDNIFLLVIFFNREEMSAAIGNVKEDDKSPHTYFAEIVRQRGKGCGN